MREEFGGGALDARATALLAEELGRSTFGGFAITVLVHTDMASPHLVNAGSPEQIKKYLPEIISGELITAVAVTEPDAGSDVKSHPHQRAARWRRLRAQGLEDVHHQRRAGRRLLRRRQDRSGGGLQGHLDLHRREGDEGFFGRPQAGQDGLALLRHRRAGVRRLPRAGRQPARRGEPRLLRHHEELPERAHRDRRDGDGRGGAARSNSRWST